MRDRVQKRRQMSVVSFAVSSILGETRNNGECLATLCLHAQQAKENTNGGALHGARLLCTQTTFVFRTFEERPPEPPCEIQCFVSATYNLCETAVSRSLRNVLHPYLHPPTRPRRMLAASLRPCVPNAFRLARRGPAALRPDGRTTGDGVALDSS